MNELEAKEILAEQIIKLRKLSYADLRKRINKDEIFWIAGKSGLRYQLEIQVFWNSMIRKHLRVVVAIDDGGWRAYKPMAEGFIVSSDGKFIGE